MFGVDRNIVKYAIHTNNHTQSTNYVLVKYDTNYRCLWTGPKSFLFSCRVKCQECMGTTYLCTGFSQNVLAKYEWIHSGYIYN